MTVVTASCQPAAHMGQSEVCHSGIHAVHEAAMSPCPCSTLTKASRPSLSFADEAAGDAERAEEGRLGQSGSTPLTPNGGEMTPNAAARHMQANRYTHNCWYFSL